MVLDNQQTAQLHIPTKENPADGTSRILNAAQVNSSECWLNSNELLQNLRILINSYDSIWWFQDPPFCGST